MTDSDRRDISTRMGKSASARAKKGKLTVIDSRCPHCGHHKAFVTDSMNRKCTKCKQRY